MKKSDKQLDSIQTEISGLKVRLRRIEQFLLGFPNVDDYLQEHEEFTEDELFERAKEIVQKYDRASASLIQRRLMIGYARASRLLDQLEEAGIVSPGEGSLPREVLKKK